MRLQSLIKIYDSLFAALVAARDLEDGEYRVGIRALLSKVRSELEEAEREDMLHRVREETEELSQRQAARARMEEVGRLE